MSAPDRYYRWRDAIRRPIWILDRQWYQLLGRLFMADRCAIYEGLAFEILRRPLTDTKPRRSFMRAAQLAAYRARKAAR